MKTIKPSALQPGDTIGIIAPAGPVTKKAIAQAESYLGSKGYEVVLGKNLFKKRGYLAGTDQQRAYDINRMFADKKIKAVICARGGYGTIRLLDQLDYLLIKNNPKILMGFSDITAMQLAIWSKTGLISFYGPMATIDLNKKMDRFTERNMWEMLSGNSLVNRALEKRSPWKIYKGGRARGRILGGCFSLIYPLIGTPYQPDFRGAILVIEDIEEDPYLIDKGLHQLKHHGVLRQINGLVIGKMTRCTARKKPTLSLDQVIRDMLPQINGPVAANLDFGHTPAKLTIPIGIKGIIDTRKGLFTLSEKPLKMRNKNG